MKRRVAAFSSGPGRSRMTETIWPLSFSPSGPGVDMTREWGSIHVKFNLLWIKSQVVVRKTLKEFQYSNEVMTRHDQPTTLISSATLITLSMPHRTSWSPCWNSSRSRDGAMVRALAPHLCDLGFDSRTRHYHVGQVCCCFSSLLERFFSRYSSFPLCEKPRLLSVS